jgi:hypothetical protein
VYQVVTVVTPHVSFQCQPLHFFCGVSPMHLIPPSSPLNAASLNQTYFHLRTPGPTPPAAVCPPHQRYRNSVQGEPAHIRLRFDRRKMIWGLTARDIVASDLAQTVQWSVAHNIAILHSSLQSVPC